jgi:flagella basal body P-ring formation protein FlgA
MMKQTSDSLLTFCPIPFNAILGAPMLPRDKAGANNRNRTPFIVYREDSKYRCPVLLGLSRPLRSLVRYGLGEGRIRSLLHGIYLALLAVSLTVPSTQVALGSDGLVISLKEEAAIRSSVVLLKDVADMQGPDQDRLKKLAQISLGPSPEFGSVKTLSRHQIMALIQDAAGLLPDASLDGAAAVQIRLQGRQIDAGEIVPLLKARLLETTPWKDSEIEIRSIGNLKGIELPPGDVVLRLSSSAAIAGHRGFLAPIEIVHADKILRCFWITAEIGIHAKVLVASHKILPGKIVAEDDVVEKPTDITDLRAAYVRNAADIVGKMSRRKFSPGDILPREAFTSPFLVKHGETVQIRLERNGIVLTTVARAEQDGRLGQIIRVRNLDFSTVLKAQVTGRSQVTLQ